LDGHSIGGKTFKEGLVVPWWVIRGRFYCATLHMSWEALFAVVPVPGSKDRNVFRRMI